VPDFLAYPSYYAGLRTIHISAPSVVRSFIFFYSSSKAASVSVTFMNMSEPVVVPFGYHNCHHLQNIKGTATAKNAISCVVFVMPLLFILMRMHNNQTNVAAISDVQISLFQLNKSTVMHETFNSNTMFKRTRHWAVSLTTSASFSLRNA
jgi:hypothetical protein